MAAYPARILRVLISEGDRFESQPLYEAIVERCRELQIAGATVFRGLEGYGEAPRSIGRIWAGEISRF